MSTINNRPDMEESRTHSPTSDKCLCMPFLNLRLNSRLCVIQRIAIHLVGDVLLMHHTTQNSEVAHRLVECSQFGLLATRLWPLHKSRCGRQARCTECRIPVLSCSIRIFIANELHVCFTGCIKPLDKTTIQTHTYMYSLLVM